MTADWQQSLALQTGMLRCRPRCLGGLEGLIPRSRLLRPILAVILLLVRQWLPTALYRPAVIVSYLSIKADIS